MSLPPDHTPNNFLIKEDNLSYINMSAEELWNILDEKTQAQSLSLKYLSQKEVCQRYAFLPCPKSTALKINQKYLHANNLGKGLSHRSFVASQAPLLVEHPLFWQAVFERNCPIVDLTSSLDQNETGLPYYPMELNSSNDYGDFSVALTKEKDNFFEYQMKNAGGEKKVIKRFHYPHWLDNTAMSLNPFNDLVSRLESSFQDELLWVHCLGGIGRTGTLITGLILKEKILKGEITHITLKQALLNLVLHLRKERGSCFVYKKEQFELLLQFGEHLISKKNKPV